jgi:rsbT co-antagonist protein RsbR
MFTNTTDTLKRNKKEILQLWIENQTTVANYAVDGLSHQDLLVQSGELLDTFIQTLNEENLSDSTSSDFDEVNELLSGISILRARQGFTPRETGNFILSLKDTLLEILKNELTDPALLFEETLKVSRLMDSLTVLTFETYIKGREDVIIRQTDEITDISTPVIKVWDGILALPIIGTLDSARTQVVMENLLQEIVNTSSGIAILDISGVPTVDSLVAQHLLKAVSATRLMGAECIISGIRPEIAQTIVHLGIDLSNIITKATLASALQYAFKSLKLEVKKSAVDNRFLNK